MRLRSLPRSTDAPETATEAIRVCEAGLAQHPAYLSARVTLGRALFELGRLEDARAEFLRVLDAAPDNLIAVGKLAEIHQHTHPLSQLMTAAMLRHMSQSMSPRQVAADERVLAELDAWLQVIRVRDDDRRAQLSLLR